MKFKLGDKVKCVDIIEDIEEYADYIGQIGVIDRVNKRDYSVDFGGPYKKLIMYEDELSHIDLVPEEMFAL